jgi:hypothetical protein
MSVTHGLWTAAIFFICCLTASCHFEIAKVRAGEPGVWKMSHYRDDEFKEIDAGEIWIPGAADTGSVAVKDCFDLKTWNRGRFQN